MNSTPMSWPDAVAIIAICLCFGYIMVALIKKM